jgi:hypothetical protein
MAEVGGREPRALVGPITEPDLRTIPTLPAGTLTAPGWSACPVGRRQVLDVDLGSAKDDVDARQA